MYAAYAVSRHNIVVILQRSLIINEYNSKSTFYVGFTYVLIENKPLRWKNLKIHYNDHL